MVNVDASPRYFDELICVFTLCFMNDADLHLICCDFDKKQAILKVDA